MIKTKKGAVKIKGSLCEVQADLSVIVYHLYHRMLPEQTNMTQEEVKDFIMCGVERAFKTKEELEEETKKSVSEILKKIADDMTSEANGESTEA